MRGKPHRTAAAAGSGSAARDRSMRGHGVAHRSMH
jgi:hypothetical protein